LQRPTDHIISREQLYILKQERG